MLICIERGKSKNKELVKTKPRYDDISDNTSDNIPATPENISIIILFIS
jgi:hypothetical protein